MSKTPRTTTVPVSVAAVVKRIRRKLAKEKKWLVAHPQSTAYCIVDINERLTEYLTVGQLAHRLGVLKPWESIQ